MTTIYWKNYVCTIVILVLSSCDPSNKPGHQTSAVDSVHVKAVEEIIFDVFDSTWHYEVNSMGEKSYFVRSHEYVQLTSKKDGSQVFAFCYLRYAPKNNGWILKLDPGVTFDRAYSEVSSAYDNAMGTTPTPHTIRVKFDNEDIRSWQVAGIYNDGSSLSLDNSTEFTEKILKTDRFVAEVIDSYGTHQYVFSTEGLENPSS